MPERGSRDLSEEEESHLSQEEAAAWQAGHLAAASSAANSHSVEDSGLRDFPVVDRDFESAAALDWSCSNEFFSTVPTEVHDPISTDDNWEEWLDRRKSPCVLHSSSSTATLKASFDESSGSDPLLTPTNTPLDRSPFESPPVETSGGDASSFITVPHTLQTFLDKQDSALCGDDIHPRQAASSFGNSTFSSTTTSDTQIGSQSEAIIGEPEDSESGRASPQESNSEATSAKSLANIPKLKKRKKAVSSEKRTTLWTQTQSTWGQFGSDSWSTGEEGCLGGF